MNESVFNVYKRRRVWSTFVYLFWLLKQQMTEEKQTGFVHVWFFGKSFSFVPTVFFSGQLDAWCAELNEDISVLTQMDKNDVAQHLKQIDSAITKCLANLPKCQFPIPPRSLNTVKYVTQRLHAVSHGLLLVSLSKRTGKCCEKRTTSITSLLNCLSQICTTTKARLRPIKKEWHQIPSVVLFSIADTLTHENASFAEYLDKVRSVFDPATNEQHASLMLNRFTPVEFDRIFGKVCSYEQAVKVSGHQDVEIVARNIYFWRWRTNQLEVPMEFVDPQKSVVQTGSGPQEYLEYQYWKQWKEKNRQDVAVSKKRKYMTGNEETQWTSRKRHKLQAGNSEIKNEDGEGNKKDDFAKFEGEKGDDKGKEEDEDGQEYAREDEVKDQDGQKDAFEEDACEDQVKDGDGQKDASEDEVKDEDGQEDASEYEVDKTDGQKDASEDEVKDEDGEEDACEDQVDKTDGQKDASEDEVKDEDGKEDACEDQVDKTDGKEDACEDQVAKTDGKEDASEDEVDKTDGKEDASEDEVHEGSGNVQEEEGAGVKQEKDEDEDVDEHEKDKANITMAHNSSRRYQIQNRKQKQMIYHARRDMERLQEKLVKFQDLHLQNASVLATLEVEFNNCLIDLKKLSKQIASFLNIQLVQLNAQRGTSNYAKFIALHKQLITILDKHRNEWRNDWFWKEKTTQKHETVKSISTYVTKLHLFVKRML